MDNLENIQLMDELMEIVKSCKGGFKYNPIIARSNTVDGKRQVLYTTEKGVYITRKREVLVEKDNVIGEKFKELWLTQNGEFVTFETTTKREVGAEYPFHIGRKFSMNQDISQYNMENILFGIKRSLERKMKSLQNRVDSQQEKIDRISDILNK